MGDTTSISKRRRVIASNGYVLVRVGTNHHLSDVRGYAYEHRIVAEKMLGRRLCDGEIVHHKDGDRQNNSPDNIDVATNIAEHFYKHRKPDSKLRKPKEENTLILCKCGCQTILTKYDNEGRPREYISGHNPMPAPTQEKILNILKNGPLNRNLIAHECNLPVGLISTTLSKLRNKGSVQRERRGIWALK